VASRRYFLSLLPLLPKEQRAWRRRRHLQVRSKVKRWEEKEKEKRPSDAGKVMGDKNEIGLAEYGTRGVWDINDFISGCVHLRYDLQLDQGDSVPALACDAPGQSNLLR
jgi:hypothetical protein